MVQNPPRPQTLFPVSAPTAYPVFYRTYSRQDENGQRESWQQVCDRTIAGLKEVGHLTEAEVALLTEMQQDIKALPSGRWLWVGGTDWVKKPENYSGAYNCTSTNVVDWDSFGLMMDLAMQGCGTGAVLEHKYISQLPAIRNRIHVEVVGTIGQTPKEQRQETTTVTVEGNHVHIKVGDSRQGWVQSYQTILELSTDSRFDGEVKATIDISDVRPAGERLNGFGGVANPVKLPQLYYRCAAILNAALGRQLSSIECCLLIDEAAMVVVAGNIRRCLPEDALVHTDRGLVPIKEIQIGDWVQTPIGFRRVINKFDQGIQEVYEIETNAIPVRATANHRYAVLSNVKADRTLDQISWKRVGELHEGDRLMHNTQVLPGTATELPPDFTGDRPEHSRTAKPLTIPALTPDVAWLIGFTHGNGYVSIGRNKPNKPYGAVTWSTNAAKPELARQIQNKIDRVLALFGLSATHSLVPGENTAKSVCSSIRFAEYCHRYIKQAKALLSVPSFILQGTIEVRAAYLAGLMDSDGAINNRPPVLVTTVYRDFARQVAAVLSSLGIAGRCHVTYPERDNWQPKYSITIPALKERYNQLIALHSVKGELRQGLKMHGFTIPGTVMREAYTYSEMRAMGFQGSHSVEANYERYIAETDTDLPIPVTVRGLGRYDVVQTYDIEVEEAHCFYCDGYLTHNSAGMRQGDSNDAEFAAAKQNLWQQDEQGNWFIDPKRDALRMANHTRVFHRKPTLEECTNAVRSQFYSGEGAIQWAGEAIARSNADILSSATLKQQFLEAYEQGQGEAFLKQLVPQADQREIQHRLGRYGLNPCVTADTWIHTGDGPRQVKDLIGKQHSTYVNGELFSTTPEGFFCSGIKPVVKLLTKEGFELRLTDDHRLLKVTAQTPKTQYTEWVAAKDLRPGDRILLHNHRDLMPWDGAGTWEEGWLLGCLLSNSGTDCNEIALTYPLENTFRYRSNGATVCQERAISATDVKKVAAKFSIKLKEKRVSAALEVTSYDFHRGLLHGLFSTAGRMEDASVRLSHGNLEMLKAAQRMLARLGIIASIEKTWDDNHPEYDLAVTRNNLLYFRQLVGFRQPHQAQKLEAFLQEYGNSLAKESFTVTILALVPDGTEEVYDCTVPGPACFDANGLIAHNCGEIISADFHCNLSEIHLNRIDPSDTVTQEKAFTAGAISVAALLNHRFEVERYRYARELDPIVGVSFTGLFDFFVHAFGVPWLEWWAQGRPNTAQGKLFKEQEAAYLHRWKEIVHNAVWDYCDRHGLKRPNRCTTVQPAGTKSLLTGASPGWHPPKAQRFIRRITFRKGDPVAMACYDYGYNVIPSQSDKDENGKLLDDPFDPRCSEWLVEIPVAVSWADLPGADAIDISQFSALAQFDFYMQVQRHYTTHNTSATIELREHEIEPLATAIYKAIQEDEGYISAALLARFDANETFPRLPFEPVSKERYEAEVAAVTQRQRISDFHTALSRYTQPIEEAGPAGCDSDKCLR